MKVKQRTPPRNTVRRRQIPSLIWEAAAVVVALAVYTVMVVRGRFIQDDAYISYRYVANFLDGHGLVWNIGERIEGFTNFGWVILMALIGRLGGDYILVSRILGFLAGAGIVLVTWLLARRILDNYPRPVVFLAVLLTGVNGALAYWSPAGLETAAFSLMTMLSVYFYVTRNWLLIWSLTLAVWFRPDGAVVAAVLIAAEAITEKRLPRFTFLSAIAAFVLSLPMVGFKLSYYGSLLPNSFYAKTGKDVTQLVNGLQYTWEFVRDYGLLGVGIAIAFFFYNSLSRSQCAVLIFFIGYIAYITAVGGDVLKVHRFFIPLVGISAITIALSAVRLVQFMPRRVMTALFAVLIVILPVASWWIPHKTIDAYRESERSLVDMMTHKATGLLAIDQSNFTAAASTIGAFGYALTGHRVIDMLGLTDSTIARHPESLPPGMTSTWKERSFNTPYVLSQAPEYVAFSTGFKPSAPAEKMLFLYPQWLESYRIIACEMLASSGSYGMNLVYRKVRPVQPPFERAFDMDFVDKYTAAVQVNVIKNPKEALAGLADAERALNGHFYAELAYLQAFTLVQGGMADSGYARMGRILERDSLVAGAQRDLYIVEQSAGNREKAAIHRRYLKLLSPEELRVADDHLQRSGSL